MNELVRWSPFKELENFSKGFADLDFGFLDFRDHLYLDKERKSIVAEIPVPGYSPKDIEATYHDGVISVRSKAEDKSRMFRYMASLGTDRIDESKISAECKDGLLKIVLGLKESEGQKSEGKIIEIR